MRVRRRKGKSTVEERVGVGVCRKGKGGTRKWGARYAMGNRMEIMDTEMVGIKKAIDRGIRECERERKRKLTIRVDNQEAIRRCKKREHTGGEMMARKIRWWWDAARENVIEDKIEWVKGHSTNLGNEQADKLAAEGSEKKGKDKDTFISFAWLEQQAREESLE